MATSLDIPEGLIRDAIATAIAESFSGEKRDAIIRDVVRAHLQYKANNYDKDTILSAAVGKMIRETALQTLDSVLEEMRPDIDRIVRGTLGDQFKDSVFTRLKAGLEQIVVKNITVSVNMDRY